MVKNLKRMKRQLERTDTHAEAANTNFFQQHSSCPRVWFVPGGIQTYARQHMDYEADRACPGKGIFLFNKLNQISEWKKDHKWKADGPQAEAYVAQRYIESPYLVGGKKFDMRLYALVVFLATNSLDA